MKVYSVVPPARIARSVSNRRVPREIAMSIEVWSGRMNRKLWVILAGISTSCGAWADSLLGVQHLLCAPGYVTHCSSGGECELRPPENYNLPDFVRIDLEGQLILSTVASGDSQSTPIQHVTRANGEIYLQGVEDGRAYSFVIDEVNGDLSISIVSNGESATAFGACTPD
jgi:hypothetical protein